MFEVAIDGHTNMARDAALLEQAESGISGVRVYSWDGPWISLGSSQVAARDLLDPDLVPWVMRPTGGKAVLHGHDVTIGLAVPLSKIDPSQDLSRSVKIVYRALAKPIVEALKGCGMPAALAEETRFVGRGPRTADCFAHVSPNDIVDTRTGVKACGCALRLTSNAVLLQASIPNGLPLVDPALLFERPQVTSGTRWDDQPFVGALEAALAAYCLL